MKRLSLLLILGALLLPLTLLAGQEDLKKAQQHFSANRMRDAERSLNRFLRQNPDHPEGQMLQCRIWLAQEKTQQAEQGFLALAEKYPKWGQPELLLAQMHMEKNQPEQALEYAKVARELITQKELAWLVTGQANERMGRDRNAFLAYQECIRVRPQMLKPLIYLVNESLKKNYVRLAAEYGEHLLTHHEKQRGKWPTLIIPFLETDRLSLAKMEIRARQKSLAGRDTPPFLDYVQGVLAYKEGDIRQAQVHLEKALSKNENMPNARQLLGAVLLEIGDLAGARRHLELVLTSSGQSLKARLVLAGLELKAGNYNRVLELTRSTTMTDATEVDLMEMRAQALDALGHQDQAAKVRKQAEEAGRLFQEIKETRARVDANPEDIEALMKLSRAHILLGRKGAALSSLQAVLAQKADHVEANYLMGLALAGMGRVLEAEPYLRKVEKQFAQDKDVQNILKQAEAARKKQKQRSGQ